MLRMEPPSIHPNLLLKHNIPVPTEKKQQQKNDELTVDSLQVGMFVVPFNHQQSSKIQKKKSVEISLHFV